MLSRLSSSLRLGAVATTTISTLTSLSTSLSASLSAELATTTSAVSSTEVTTTTAAVFSAGLGLLASLNDKSVFVLAGGTVLASTSAELTTAATISATTTVVTTATAVASLVLLSKLGAGLVGNDNSFLALLNYSGGSGGRLGLLLGGFGKSFWNFLGDGCVAVEDIEVVAEVEGAIADNLVSVVFLESLLVVLGLDEGVHGEEGDASFANQLVGELG